MSRTLTLLLTLAAGTALAQREPPDEIKVADDGGPPRVYFAHSYNDGGNGWYSAGLGDRLSVHIQNFEKLLEKTNGTCSGIVLFIEGMPIQGLKAESCDEANGHVRYLLQRTEESQGTWSVLLGKPRHHVKTVGISVGANDQFSIPSRVDSFQLIVVPRSSLWGFAGFAVTLLAIFVWLSLRTGLIRARGGPANVRERPYSISMFQMVFWFYLVISAYIFIWLVTEELDTITESVLALLGVGTGTALGSTLIEGSARKKGAKPAAASGSPLKSQGFLHDLMDEGGTMSLSRFQLFLWTIALGFIFWRSVYNNLHMPEFSATLLVLMGISSGTYLGFKTQKPPDVVPDPAPAVLPAQAVTPAAAPAPSSDGGESGEAPPPEARAS